MQDVFFDLGIFLAKKVIFSKMMSGAKEMASQNLAGYSEQCFTPF